MSACIKPQEQTHTPYKEVKSLFKSTAKTLQPVSRDDYYTALVNCVFLLLSSCDFTVWSSGLRSSWEPGTRIHKPNSISDRKICIFYQLLVSFAKVSLFSYNLLLPLKSWLLFLEAHQVSKQIKHYPPSTAADVSVQLFTWMRIFCLTWLKHFTLHRYILCELWVKGSNTAAEVDWKTSFNIKKSTAEPWV